MCGIVGILVIQGSKRPSPDVARKMCDAIVHRGPDSDGYFSDENIALGMRRLSIIDVAGGHQPIRNETGMVHLVCNGEIYNHLELRAELEVRGHVFRTRSDVEVILHLYEEHGSACVNHLRGMFAFAIWDAGRERLTLGRDRLGKKPIYYRIVDNSFIFGSELGCIMAASSRPPINLRALSDYLALQYVPAPETIFEGIFKLPAAHTIELARGGEPGISRYWQVDYRRKTALSHEEAIERLDELLTDAVRMRLMSEVPLGVFLSAGLDSSLVTALMTETSASRVQSFCIGFDQAAFNEAPMAEETAAFLGTDHTTFHLDADLLAEWPKSVSAFGEPFADPSALPTYLLCREARKQVTVALTGDGGDEGFAGYSRYALNRLARGLRRCCPEAGAKLIRRTLDLAADPGSDRSSVTVLKRLFEGLHLPADLQNIRRQMLFDDSAKQRMLSPELLAALDGDRSGEELSLSWYEAVRADHPLDRDLAHDIDHYLPDDILVKADIASMSNSLELRSPLLDHKVIEFAASLPAAWKLRGLKSGKHCLRAVARRHLPKHLLERRKMGFSLPIAEWFRDPRRDFLREVLLDSATVQRGIIDVAGVERMIADHVARRDDHSKRLWALATLAPWFHAFAENERPVIRSAA